MGSVRFKNQLNSAPLLAKPLTSGDKFGPDYVGGRGKQPPNRLSWRMTTNNVLTDVIAEFGRKYLWWERDAFGFVRGAAILQDSPDTLVVLAAMPSGLVKVSFFGGIGFGCVRRLALVPGSANRYCSPSFETATEPVIGRAFARPVGGLLQR